MLFAVKPQSVAMSGKKKNGSRIRIRDQDQDLGFRQNQDRDSRNRKCLLWLNLKSISHQEQLQPYLKNKDKIWNDSSSKQINMPIIIDLPENNTFLRISRMWKWVVKVATNLMWNMIIEWSELRIGEVISYSWHRVMTRCHFHFRRHYLSIVHCTCFHYLQLYLDLHMFHFLTVISTLACIASSYLSIVQSPSRPSAKARF